MTPADLRELREDLRTRGGPAAALAEALPDRLDAAALDAITPGVVRALRATIYGKTTVAEAGRGEESATTPRDERQENQLDGGKRNASRTTPR
jgi:hypothetical protein